jgi:predicted acylesterase/phospholipase RssA
MRVLCLGGGGLRAAFQVPIVEALVPSEGYALIIGISAGAVNGAFAAQHDFDELRRGWEASTSRNPFRGVPGVFTVSRRPWQSPYSLAPLRARLKASIGLERLRVAFACGVVVRETREYRLLAASEMVDDSQLHSAIVASGSIAGLMPPVAFRDPEGSWTLSDGGHRHNLPPVPPTHESRVTNVDAVFCSPLAPEPAVEHRGLPHSVAWAFENYLELTKHLDVDYLKTMSEAGEVSVRIYAPARPMGGILDGHPRTIRSRIEQGQKALDHPLLL